MTQTANNAPSASAIFDLIDRSWPPVATSQVGPWMIRQGSGGSKRVMAASLLPGQSLGDFEAAEAAMAALNQPALFQIRGENADLDAALEARGYDVIDRCTIFAAPAADLAADIKPAMAWAVWPPLACQREVWQAGGIGPGRIAIMERAPHPKAAFIGRLGDAPVGAAFVAGLGDLAMVHAVETLAAHRKKGVGRLMMQAAANWCLDHGIRWLTLITTDDNRPSIALYSNLGMNPVGTYHYRIKEPR